MDSAIRIFAILLSVSAAICGALEGVYSYRLRGQVRRGYGDQLNDLFQSFETLSGPLFDPSYAGKQTPGRPPARAGEGSFVMPDLSGIPRAVLRAQLDHMDELDAADQAYGGGAAPATSGRRCGPRRHRREAKIPRHRRDG